MIKIIADSAIDVTEVMHKEKDVKFISVPFKMNIGEKVYVDNENLDVPDFVKSMVSSDEFPKSACPSPNDFYEAINGEEEEVYIITITSKLSGTYNSAKLGINMFVEDYGENKKIHLFDSESASGGEALIYKKIIELKAQGKTFEEVVEEVEDMIKDIKTLFVAESLNNLMKNGRIGKLKGKIASRLRITPLMGAEDGEIVLKENARTPRKAYDKLIQTVLEDTKQKPRKILFISHVQNEKQAQALKDALTAQGNFEEIIILKCHGLTSMYVDNQGIIVAY